MVNSPEASSTTILLHTGIHKTGSTTLQESFTAHRSRLAEAGVIYLGNNGPYPGLYSAFLEDPVNFFWNRKFGFDEEQVRKHDAQALETLSRALSEHQGATIVLSNEFLGMLPTQGMRELREFLAPFGRVVAVYFHRDPPGWLASNSQELAKAGIATEPTAFSYALERIHDFPLRHAEVFGPENCRFIRFESAVRQGICNAFLRANGLPCFDQLGLFEIVANTGISAAAVEALYAYNARYPHDDARRDPVEVERLKALPGPPYKIEGFYPDEIRAYARARARVQEALALDLPPPEALPVRPLTPWAWLHWQAGRLRRRVHRMYHAA